MIGGDNELQYNTTQCDYTMYILDNTIRCSKILHQFQSAISSIFDLQAMSIMRLECISPMSCCKETTRGLALRLCHEGRRCVQISMPWHGGDLSKK